LGTNLARINATATPSSSQKITIARGVEIPVPTAIGRLLDGG
jgi:hypothetical protein